MSLGVQVFTQPLLGDAHARGAPITVTVIALASIIGQNGKSGLSPSTGGWDSGGAGGGRRNAPAPRRCASRWTAAPAVPRRARLPTG